MGFLHELQAREETTTLVDSRVLVVGCVRLDMVDGLFRNGRADLLPGMTIWILEYKYWYSSTIVWLYK